MDDRVYEEALTPRNDDSDHAERDLEANPDEAAAPAAAESTGDAVADGADTKKKVRARFDLPTDKFERKRSPQFLLTHNPDLDLGCDCLQLVQAYGTNRTKWKPKWNIERKDENFRADLDVSIRDSSDLVLVRGHWCDSERAAKRSAAVEGCKRLTEKGEKRQLIRLALMVGAWVYIAKHGEGADHDLALKIITQAKELLEQGDFKRGGAPDKEESPTEASPKVVSKSSALGVIDGVFDQVWGEKRFIRRMPIYEVERKDGGATSSGGVGGYKIIVTVPKLKGTFEEDTVVEGPVGESILEARRLVAWDLAVLLHEKGKLPNHVLDRDADTATPASTATTRQEKGDNTTKRSKPEPQTRSSYTDKDRERDREREQRDNRDSRDNRSNSNQRDQQSRDRDRARDDRDDRDRRDREDRDRRRDNNNGGNSQSNYDDSDVRSDRRRSPPRDTKRKDRGDDDYSSDAKRRKRD